MSELNQETRTKLNEDEVERLAQDFEAPVDVREKLQELIQEIHSLCTEHEIPFLLFVTLAKENLDDGNSKLEGIHSATIPGNRAPGFLNLANTILEKRIGHPVEFLMATLSDSDDE